MRKTTLNSLILFAFAAFPADVPGQTGGWLGGWGQPLIGELSTERTGRGGYYWDLLWDESGVAYLGRDQLWRWDGSVWKALGPSDLRLVRALCFDPEGRVWVGSYNALGVFDPDTQRYEPRMDLIPERFHGFGNLWSLHHDGSALWLGTDRQLFRIRGDDFRSWEFSGEHRILFHFLPSGVYAHQVDRGIWKIREDGKDLVNDDPLVARQSVVFLEEQSSGHFLAVSGLGIFQLGVGLEKVIYHNEMEEIGQKPFSDVVRLSKDFLVIGTLEKGLYFINDSGELLRSLKKENFFKDEIILGLKIGPLHQLYILKTTGIARLDYRVPCLVFDNRSGFPEGNISSLLFFDQSIRFSSEKGFFSLKSGNSGDVEIYRYSMNESSKCLSYKENFFFINYASLMREAGGEVEEWHGFGRAIRNFDLSVDGHLYVSFTDRVEAYRLEGERVGEYAGGQRTLNSLQKLESDGTGRAWAWSPRTPLHEFRAGAEGLELTRHDIVAGKDLFATEYELSVTESGPVLVFGASLARLWDGDGGWEEAEAGLPAGLPLAYDFREREGTLQGWLVYWDEEFQTNTIIAIEWPRDGELRHRIVPWVDMRSIGYIHKMEVVEEPEPLIVIAGTEGLLLARPDLPQFIPPPDPPVLWDATLGDRPARERTYGPDSGGIRYRFSSPMAGSLYPVRYQTRLRGLEKDWRDPQALPVRELGQVRGGDYTFEVRAVDPFGRVSEASAVHFRQLPPWYLRVWAFFGYALLLFLAVEGYLWYRQRRLRTAQVRLEGLVRERTAELRKANQVKDDFVANLSHEIRNPLNGVIGLIRQLKEGVQPPSRHLASLREAAHYLQTTVEDVLDFAKLQSGGLEPHNSRFDIAVTARSALGIYKDQATRKGLGLTSRIRIPEGKGLFADERKLQQIIGNLTGNAVKFTDAGSVHVEISLQEDREDHGFLKIRVEDTGPGIDPSEQERIFDKFYQGRTGDQKTKGTGLGLALIKAYLDCLGGHIDLESTPGKGSTFLVVVPVATCRYDSALHDPDKVSVRAAGVRVLVVEDVEYNRIVIEDLLRDLGCEVDCAATGTLGLEMALHGGYDLVFLDWDLPEMNGLEVARALRGGLDRIPGTRLIGLTAYATMETREKCIDAGMDAFMTKPLDPRQVGTLLSGIQPRSANRMVTGRGILGEMAAGKDWNATKSRWRGILDAHLEELRTAAAGDDPEAARKAAHKLLGHLRMIKTEGLADFLLDLMTAARGRDMNGIRAEWEGFDRKLPILLKEVDRL